MKNPSKEGMQKGDAGRWSRVNETTFPRGLSTLLVSTEAYVAVHA